MSGTAMLCTELTVKFVLFCFLVGKTWYAKWQACRTTSESGTATAVARHPYRWRRPRECPLQNLGRQKMSEIQRDFWRL